MSTAAAAQAPGLPPRRSVSPSPPVLPARPIAPAEGEVAPAQATATSSSHNMSFASVAALTHRVTNSLSTHAAASAKTASASALVTARAASAQLPTVRQVLDYHPLRLAYKALAPYVSNKDNRLGEDTPDARRRNLDRLHFVTSWLDAKYAIPFTNYKVGLDPVVSAIPMVGDVISTTLSLYVVYLARRFHVPWWVTAKMVFNVVLNASFGAVPIVGSAFDVAYKPNLRNLILLEEYLKKEAVKLGSDPKIIDRALAKSRQDLWPDQVISSEGEPTEGARSNWPEAAVNGTVPLTR